MMTIESLLERIASSCERQERLIEQLLGHSDNQQELLEVVKETVEHIQEEVAEIEIPAAPAAAPAPTPPPAPAAAPAPTVPPPSSASAPAVFADQKAFMDYCMAKYKALGPIKGGMIQQILIDLGASSIMGLPAEKWAEFRAKVEML